MNKRDLQIAATTLLAVHQHESGPIRFLWADLRFDPRPSREELTALNELLKPHNLMAGVLPKVLDGCDGFALTNEELKEAGGFTLSEDQLLGISSMLDDDPDEVAKFLVAKGEGRLKGEPPKEDN